MPIKTFRGKIADGGIDTIVLHTNTGSTGYRIVKLQGLPKDANSDLEAVLKIYKVDQTAADTDIDFSDQTLLGAMIITNDAAEYYQAHTEVILDTETFNQDISLTCKGHDKTGPVNYYIELEQVKLDLGENTVATLKDIRNKAVP